MPPRRTAPVAEMDETPVARAPQPTARYEAPAPRYDEDDMPRPAYQPETRQPEARPAPAAQADALNGDAGGFVAPTRRAPQQQPAGTPSDAVMQRLAAAVQRAPERQAAAQQRSQAQPPQPQQPAADATRNPSRMGGLSRMLERISGHGEQAEKPSPATIAERVNERVAARSRSGFDAGFDDLASPDRADDNVEIPAFLRRQAN